MVSKEIYFQKSELQPKRTPKEVLTPENFSFRPDISKSQRAYKRMTRQTNPETEKIYADSSRYKEAADAGHCMRASMHKHPKVSHENLGPTYQR